MYFRCKLCEFIFTIYYIYVFLLQQTATNGILHSTSFSAHLWLYFWTCMDIQIHRWLEVYILPVNCNAFMRFRAIQETRCFTLHQRDCMAKKIVGWVRFIVCCLHIWRVPEDLVLFQKLEADKHYMLLSGHLQEFTFCDLHMWSQYCQVLETMPSLGYLTIWSPSRWRSVSFSQTSSCFGTTGASKDSWCNPWVGNTWRGQDNGTEYRQPALPIWVFPKMVVPQNGWFIMEDPIKIYDFGVPIIFGNTHIVYSIYIYIIHTR